MKFQSINNDFMMCRSSMGTLILLYFTLSMGKMAGRDADAR